MRFPDLHMKALLESAACSFYGGSHGIAHHVPSLVSCSSGDGNYCFQMFFS
ncbi:hypothetical protein KC19_2G230200 [Ceratodon purpureus]|uniref:Uncharacterized protein n=1 Tax=Ceratodon purpureus TaxID=3225 RepID=A0A8T0IZW2_CERPU|nr:hypothetical protein KC19_2G230200 [Ceratodon purpureus]